LHCARHFSTPGVLLIAVAVLISARGEYGQSEPTMPPQFMISEYRVHGAHALSPLEVETAVYPFLGPLRTQEDVQAACASLEKAYHDKGYGAATVQYTPRVEKGGVIELQVSEGTVERLRVKGARYFSPNAIKAAAPSLSEGNVINFDEVSKDIVSLNQVQDRTVTPVLQPGTEPGTYDIDLNVKDSSPTHASVELNDYRSPNTTPLRITASASDGNLWQAANGAGVSLELAPTRPSDAEVFTGYYLARFPGIDGFSVMLQGTKQDSNISTLGGSTVAGPGETYELRLNWVLPNGKDWSTGKDWENFSHSLYLALDYKHFQQTINTTPGATGSQAGTIVTPITYYPVTLGYSAFLKGVTDKDSTTNVNLGVTVNFRGMGSGPAVFDLNRYGADGGFIYLRGSVDHTANLPGGLQVYGRVQGQVANQPLVSSEEFSGGGEQTVRGYLESEEVGDDGVFATLELRSPPLGGLLGKNMRDWRVYLFGDTGELTLIDPLPEQKARFDLTSVGFGSRLLLGDHLGGAFDAGYPLTSETYTMAHDLRMTFRLDANF
jgi:hemolysin activation/secretion protein